MCERSPVRNLDVRGDRVLSIDLRAPRRNEKHDDNASSPVAVRTSVRPSWQQPKVMIGAAIMTASVVLGALLIGSADNTASVWAAKHDLSAGTTVTQADLVPIAVNGENAGRYIDAQSQDLVGKQLSRSVGAQELLPVSAVAVSPSDTRLVTVPVEPAHAPHGLTRGERVDVYLSARESAAATASRLVLANALVDEVADDIDSASGQIAVVLQVSADQAAAVVSASRGGVIDLVRVPIEAK